MYPAHGAPSLRSAQCLMMGLQWTVVATVLYAEVLAVLLLCSPFISPQRWQKIFRSRLVLLVVSYGQPFFGVLVLVLALLLLDAVREIRKYDEAAPEKGGLRGDPLAAEQLRVKLFRAQRNLHVAGFSLLLSLLLRRLVALQCQQASLQASREAFRKQATGAREAAQRYLDENARLREAAAHEARLCAASEAQEENRRLKADLEKLRAELAASRGSLERARAEAATLRRRCEELARAAAGASEEDRSEERGPPPPGHPQPLLGLGR